MRELGRGGMGVVYEAEQRAPRRRVALKVLPVLGSARLGTRLRQEAHVLGQMNHPGIARVFDAGVASVGGQQTPYIAMELVEGGTLDAYVRERGLTRAHRLELIARVADAVQAAHGRGVIHRDLKPGNILVAPEEGGVGQPKVLDFGVARLTNADLLVTSVRTETSQLVGTVHYMSPEQLDGDSRGVDARSDVYALGVIAYEILAGRRPFDLDGLPLVRAISRVQSARPASLGSLDSALSGDVELIVSTAMERDAARRYQTAAEFAAEIRRFLRREPILARPASAAYQMRRFAQRNTALVGAAGVAVLALVAGLVISVGALRTVTAARDDARAALDRAEHAERVATTRADEAEAINGFMRDLLSEADPWRTGGDVTVRDAIASGERLVDERFGDRPAVEMGLRQSIGEAYLGIGLFDEAIEQFERVVAIGTGAGEGAGVRVLEARLALARACERSGRTERGLDVLAKVERSGALDAAPADRRISLWISESGLRTQTGEYDEAIRLARLASEEAERTLPPNDDVTLSSLNGLGWKAAMTGLHDEAAEVFERLLAAHEAERGPSHIKSIVSRNGLAQTRFGQGRFEEAERLFRENVRYGEAEFSEGHPDLFVTLSGLSNTLMELREFDEALRLAERALEMSEDARGPDHVHTMIVRNNHAESLAKVGRERESLELHLENLERRRRGLGDEHPDVAQSLASIGAVLVRMDRFAEAERYLRDAIDRYEGVYGPESGEVVNNTMNLAQALHKMGELDAAIAMMTRVVEIEKRTLPENHRYIALDLEKLAGMHFDAGRYPEAAALWREAIGIWTINLGEAHVDVLRWRARAARGEYRAGNAERAFSELDEIDEALTRDGAEPDRATLASVSLVRAELMLDEGDRAEASAELTRAEGLLEGLEIDEQTRARVSGLRERASGPSD